MSRLLIAFLLVAGCDTGDSCAPYTACSAGSVERYRFCSGHGADDCYYQMGDGTKYHCATCGDCTNAQDLVAAWCAAEEPNGLLAGVSCGSTTACPSGNRAYQICTSSTGSSCSYRGNDGTNFDCNGCSDCTAAAQAVATWCGGSTTVTPGGTCGQPGDPPLNSTGVGKYCDTSTDCSNNGSATLCSALAGGGTNFCTFLCDATVADECGAGAFCYCANSSGCACVPNQCSSL